MPDIEAAAAVAYERATTARDEADELTGRVLTLEVKVALLEATQVSHGQGLAQSSTHRTSVTVALISLVGAVVAAVITGAWQATSTKKEAVQQSTYAVDRKIENSKQSTEATFDNGYQRALEDFNRKLAVEGLVIVPKEVIRARPSSSAK